MIEEGGGPILGAIAQHYGLPGAIIAALLTIIILQDRRNTKLHEDFAKALKSEQDARIEDAKNYTKMAMDLQSRVIDAVNKLTTIFETLKEMRR